MQAHAMASTLDVVKKRGYVTCGVSQGLPGFSNPDDSGRGKALMSIYAKAIAAAIFVDANKTKIPAAFGQDPFYSLAIRRN